MPTKNRIKLEHLKNGTRLVTRKRKGQKGYVPRYGTITECGCTTDRFTHRSRDYVKVTPDVFDGPPALYTYYLDTLNEDWQLAGPEAPPRPRCAVRVTLQEHELAHVLAGLRLLQERSTSWHTVCEIIDSGGRALSSDEIEQLIQRINTAPEAR